MLTTMTLWVLLQSGAVERLEEPASPLDCAMMLAVASAVRDAEHAMSRDHMPITRIDCGGRSIVLMLPSSAGICDLGGA